MSKRPKVPPRLVRFLSVTAGTSFPKQIRQVYGTGRLIIHAHGAVHLMNIALIKLSVGCNAEIVEIYFRFKA